MAPPLFRGLLFLLATLALLQVSYGAVHNVGDAAGWTAAGGVDYARWASARSFRVGDSLVFNYNNKFHNVKQVSHQDFVSCNATSPIAVYTTGSDSVILKSPGHYYFLCGFPGHCERGQKLDVLAEPSGIRGPTTSPSPAPSSSASPMPPSSPPIASGSSPPHLALAVFASWLLLTAPWF